MYDTKADLDEFTVRIARPSILGSTYSSSPIFANEWIARANTTNIKYIIIQATRVVMNSNCVPIYLLIKYKLLSNIKTYLPLMLGPGTMHFMINPLHYQISVRSDSIFVWL